MPAVRLRRPDEGHEAGQERWLLTYADLITLLLVFFIVLYSISKADTAKFERFSSSIQQAFNVSVLPTPISTSSSGASLESDPRFVTFLTVRTQMQALIGRFQLSSDAASVELTHEGIVIHLSDAVLFPPSSADLRPDSLQILDGLAEIIGPMSNELQVEGNTDNVPPSDARYSDNLTLSAMRAVNTVHYLVNVRGIPPARLAAVGYGDARPIADNSTIDGRRKNRRVDFVIVSPGV